MKTKKEMRKPIFDWEKFKNECIAVHCNNEAEAYDFILQARKNGINFRWYPETQYKIYKDDLCYIFKFVRLDTDDIDFCKRDGYSIIEWRDYFNFILDETYNMNIIDVLDDNDSEDSLYLSNKDNIPYIVFKDNLIRLTDNTNFKNNISIRELVSYNFKFKKVNRWEYQN